MEEEEEEVKRREEEMRAKQEEEEDRDEGNRGEEAEELASGGEVTRRQRQTGMNNLSTLLMDRLGEKMKRDEARERERRGSGGSKIESRGRGGIK